MINQNIKTHLVYLFLVSLIGMRPLAAFAFVDSWKILKNAEDMIDVLDTAQDVGETLEEDTPNVDQTKSDIIIMRRDLKELGYTGDEIEELMSPYEFGHTVNTDSIRKLNRHVRRIKNLNQRILATAGLKGTPEGITARQSIESNLTLQNIHSELVQDRVLRERKESHAQKLELQEKIREEKTLKAEMGRAKTDSQKTLGFAFSPFKLNKGKELQIE